MKRVIEVLTAHVDEYVERSLDRVLAARASVYTNMPRHVLKAAIGMAIGAVAEDVARGTTMSYPAHLANVGVQRAKRGVPIAEMIRSLELGFQVISDHFTEVFKDDLEARLWWESRKHEISYAGALAVTDAFYETREAIITEQSRQLMALAAPILPLGEGILVLPIVGSLDEQRAARVIEALLASVVKHRSEVVIIDVTGMHAVDTSATEHLLRAARAARLLGATVLLVGIRAEAALAFTNAGADLGGITTLADLTRGLAHALLLRRRSAR